MNYFTLASTCIPMIMEAVQLAQGLTGMTGAEKSAVVLQQVSNSLPPDIAQHPETVTRIQGWINGAVSMFNLIHPLFKKTATVTPTPVATVIPATASVATTGVVAQGQ